MLERIPAHLSQKLSQVASRQAGLALWLWGEAGVGKSDALERLLQSVGFRTLRLSPHLDLAHLLLALLEIPSSVPIPSWLEHSQTRLGRGETLERETLLQAVCAALEGLAPVALAVEDLYQAPLEVREGWTALAGRVARLKGVALLVTAREAPEIPETPAQNWEILRQEAMTEAETLTLLEAQVGATLPPGAGEWVHQRSQGNPALTLELFRFVAQGGSLYNDGTQWHWRIPPEGRVPIGVEALLLERVRHLRQDPDLERVLLAHAFLPENQARACVLAGLPPTVWQSGTARLEREGLLRGGVWLLPMLAGVLQNALPPTERSQWLRQRIEVLCQPLPQLPPLDELPPDYLAAVRDLETAWLEPAEQLRVLRGAAEQAEKLGYWRQAAEL